jgi:hypothetical protein
MLDINAAELHLGRSILRYLINEQRSLTLDVRVTEMLDGNEASCGYHHLSLKLSYHRGCRLSYSGGEFDRRVHEQLANSQLTVSEIWNPDHGNKIA